jgi:hypothetical protein
LFFLQSTRGEYRIQKFKEWFAVGDVSGRRSFCEHSQKELSVGYPTECLVIACVADPLNRAITKEVKCTSHPMTKFEQRAARGFAILKGLRPGQIQTELSDMYQRQTFQLLALKKWHFRAAGRTRDLEDRK